MQNYQDGNMENTICFLGQWKRKMEYLRFWPWLKTYALPMSEFTSKVHSPLIGVCRSLFLFVAWEGKPSQPTQARSSPIHLIHPASKWCYGYSSLSLLVCRYGVGFVWLAVRWFHFQMICLSYQEASVMNPWELMAIFLYCA